MGAGFLLGSWAASLLGGAALKQGYGALVALLSLAELGGLRALAPGPRSGPAAVFGAGVVHGLVASGGPLLVWAVGRDWPEPGRFRVNLQAVWLVLGALLLVRYAWAGQLNVETLSDTATLVPALLVGGSVGEWLHPRISARWFRRGVFFLLLVSGLLLIGG